MSTAQGKVTHPKIFHALTPSEDSDITGYKEALDHALKPNNIKNIGITGAYGAGKSSVVRSYEKSIKESDPNSVKVFIYISLAYFQPQHEPKGCSENNCTNNQNTQKIDAVEHKIINQLVHQIDPKLIPHCIFGKKQNMANRFAWLSAAAFVYAIFYALHLLSPATTARMQLAMPWLNFLFSPFFASLGFFLFLGIISYGIFHFLKHGGMAWNITKFSLGPASLEKKDSHDTKSVFDTHLADVVYIFENCGADVVVFEDLDRFDTNRIFKKLREINLCANSGDKKIKFIYMVRDDVFKSVERVKFFDYIIPIVPTITSHNSYGRMRELSLQDFLSDKFMKGIAQYVDDMRMLYNICNEFMIYKGIVQLEIENDSQQFCEKLFSIIVYKNFFSREYNKDQYFRGILSTIVKKKKIYLNV